MNNCRVICNSAKECAFCLQFFDLIGIRWSNNKRTTECPHCSHYGNKTVYYIINGVLSFSSEEYVWYMYDSFSMMQFFAVNGFNAKIIILLRKIMSNEIMKLCK